MVSLVFVITLLFLLLPYIITLVYATKLIVTSCQLGKLASSFFY